MKLKSLLFFLFITFWFITGCGDDEGEISMNSNGEDKIFPVEVSYPSVEDVPYILTAVGSLLPLEEINVASEIVGKIEKVLVEEGDKVRKGDLLVKIDDERFVYRVERCEAVLKQTQAELANAQLILKRKKELYEEGAIPRQMYDDALTQHDSAQGTVERAKAELRLARRDLRDTKVYASADGGISKKIVSEGDFVDEMNRDLLTIVCTNPLKLSFTVPERYVSQIELGQEAKVRVKAYPGEEFSGEIYSINPQVDAATRTVEIKAYVKNEEGRLKPGFFADVSLLTAVHKDALLLPETAVLILENKSIVFIVENDVASRREVKMGRRLSGKIEILEGLKVGEIVITAGQVPLHDGAQVRVEKQSSTEGRN
jgi:membrane fusion protein (multidrug efflux system)